MRYIKIACIAVFRAVLTVWYAFVRLFVKKGDAVAFISRESDNITVEFSLISKELSRRRPDTEQIFCCKRAAKSEIGLGYIKELNAQLKALAKAKVAVIDTYCIPVSMLSHKRLTVIQLWHAITIIKQFGWQTVGKAEGTSKAMAKAMRMHSGYDAVIAGSEQMRPILSKTMNQPIEKIYALGLPLSDKLLAVDGEAVRESFLKAHPEAEGKKIISYVPTMRRNSPVPCEELINTIDSEKECLFVSLHPVDLMTEIKPCQGVIIDPSFSSQDAVFFADVVVTDYSGTSAEAVLAKKPLLFYVPDIDIYQADCGLNVNPEEHFESISFRNAEKLFKIIRDENYDEKTLQKAGEMLVGSCDGKSTARIADMVEKALQSN